MISGVCVSWFAVELHTETAKLLDFEKGECTAQQTVEALAILLALRSWSQQWRGRRPVLEVKSDNVGALTMVIKMRSKGKGTGIIAREMALDIALGEYQPNVVSHAPGVSATIVDALSRKGQPGVDFHLPALLRRVPEAHLPPIGRDFFRTLGNPQRTGAASGSTGGSAA